MEGAIAAIRVEAESRGIALDPGADPNRTGLVGLSWTGLTTTLGSLPAKRTGAQPDAAALLARLLLEAGVGPGDRVAVDSSGSFPGFAVAALVAVRSLGAVPVAVISVGSSTWGPIVPSSPCPTCSRPWRAAASSRAGPRPSRRAAGTIQAAAWTPKPWAESLTGRGAAVPR